jgi:hypothetical protein
VGAVGLVGAEGGLVGEFVGETSGFDGEIGNGAAVGAGVRSAMGTTSITDPGSNLNVNVEHSTGLTRAMAMACARSIQLEYNLSVLDGHAASSFC